jgi:hypothetical protein
MDVYGRKPINETGEYFRASIWSWPSLWAFCCEAAPSVIDDDTARRCSYNDGAGLDARQATALAIALWDELENWPTSRSLGVERDQVRRFADFCAASGGFEVH